MVIDSFIRVAADELVLKEPLLIYSFLRVTTDQLFKEPLLIESYLSHG
jgi:hypothetical protein